MEEKERKKLQKLRKWEAELSYASPRRAAKLAEKIVRFKTGD